jgi:hypothetical protein
MQSYSRRLLLSLAAALIVGGILSQSASAAISWNLSTRGILWWQRVVAETSGTFDFKIGAEKEIECTASDKGELEAGARTSITEITFSPCEQTKPAKCPAKVSAQGLPWSAFLRARATGAKWIELTHAVTLSYTIEMPCTVVVNQKISGNEEGEWSNSSSADEFPSSPLPESTLTSEGVEVVLSGSDKDKAGSETVTATEWPGKWLVAGASLGEGKAALASSAQVDSAALLRVPSAAVKIACTATSVKASNPEILWEYLGLAGLVTFEGCSTTEPKTQCELANSKVASAPIAAKAEEVTKSSADHITVVPQTKAVLAEVQFKEGTTCAFEGIQPLKGSVTFNAPTGQTEAAGQTIEGLGSTENNSLELGAGNKAFVEGGKLLVRLTSSSKWAFK